MHTIGLFVSETGEQLDLIFNMSLGTQIGGPMSSHIHNLKPGDTLSVKGK